MADNTMRRTQLSLKRRTRDTDGAFLSGAGERGGFLFTNDENADEIVSLIGEEDFVKGLESRASLSQSMDA